MQVQIQALLTAEEKGAESAKRRAIESNAKPAIFNGEAERVGGFVIACRLYLRMKIKKATVEEQMQWVLSYVQGGSADV